MQAYASRLGLRSFTFPEPAPPTSGSDNESDEADCSSSDGEVADDDSNTGEDSKNASGDGNESDEDIVDPALPKIRRRVVKLGHVAKSS